MAAKGKCQVKLYLTDASHDALKEASKTTGKTMSVLVEDLITEVLIPEMASDEKTP